MGAEYRKDCTLLMGWGNPLLRVGLEDWGVRLGYVHVLRMAVAWQGVELEG